MLYPSSLAFRFPSYLVSLSLSLFFFFSNLFAFCALVCSPPCHHIVKDKHSASHGGPRISHYNKHSHIGWASVLLIRPRDNHKDDYITYYVDIFIMYYVSKVYNLL
uniref:Uncharacterized protein n=1 Tax=Oryza brachyantha TaxID=4533 RepID=J3N7R8_ORYBR